MSHRLVVTLALNLLAGVRVTQAAIIDVTVGGATFSPKTVTIAIGDTVRWTNSSGGTHTVTSDDGAATFRQPPAASFVFTHTFDTAATIGYHCEIHGSPGGGMFGTVIVSGGPPPPPPEPGILGFTLATTSIGEGAGSATISVQRVGGDDGAVSVHYSASSGTATAGQDFVAVAGTLAWADGNAANKSFAVPILDDTVAENSETVALTLAAPSGGATLDPARTHLTLTIQDNDSAAGGTPAAPTNLAVVGQSTSEVMLTWSDNSTNETGFRVERRTIDGTFAEVATAGAGVTMLSDSGLDPSTFYLYRVRAGGGGATASGYSNEAGTATLGNVTPCVAGSHTLCLNNGRFRVEVAWHTVDATGNGQTVPLPSAPDSGLFYFFGPSNIEMLVKVLNACVPTLGNHYWTFFAATTNVEFAMVLSDSQTGKTKAYYNPLNRSALPVQDVDAFATCP